MPLSDVYVKLTGDGPIKGSVAKVIDKKDVDEAKELWLVQFGSGHRRWIFRRHLEVIENG